MVIAIDCHRSSISSIGNTLQNLGPVHTYPEYRVVLDVTNTTGLSSSIKWVKLNKDYMSSDFRMLQLAVLTGWSR